MKKLGRTGSTLGTVVAAALVLSVATTGGAVAGGLITSKQIKNNTIKSIDVRDGNLTGTDIADGSIGSADIANSALAGAVGRTLASGTTVRGTIGGMSENLTAGQETGYTASLPAMAPAALDDTHVAVDGSDEPTGACPGTATNPTAAPGYVCIYPWFNSNGSAGVGYIWGSDASANEKFGFQLSVNAVSGGSVSYFANWAYTAP